MAKITVALFDEFPVLLEGLISSLRLRSEYKLVGRGFRTDDALRTVRQFRPDVLITDLKLTPNPFDAIAAIGKLSPQTKIVVFTASTSVDHAIGALEAGALGYVLKTSTAEELFEAVESVRAGQTFITPSFAATVISALRQPRQAPAPQSARFSVREEQIVALLLSGRTNREIALQLKLSEKTVKHYMTLLMQKLQARNRLEVVIEAHRLGLTAAERSPALA